LVKFYIKIIFYYILLRN